MSELLARMPGDTPTLPTLSNLRDPRTWLEDVEGNSALAFAREKNAAAVAALGEPTEDPMYTRILSILDSKEKIPYIGRVLNGLYYNFWQDATRVRGVWQRCTLEQYRAAQPAWEVVLDLDALSKEEGVTWVWGGSVLLDEGLPHDLNLSVRSSSLLSPLLSASRLFPFSMMYDVSMIIV